MSNLGRKKNQPKIFISIYKSVNSVGSFKENCERQTQINKMLRNRKSCI